MNHSYDLQQHQIVHQRYRILTPIGVGGTSKVYLTEDLMARGKLRAFKRVVLPPFRQRTISEEADILAQLDQPNLPMLIQFYSSEDEGYSDIVTNYIRGRTLQSFFEDFNYVIPVEIVVNFAIKLCNILEYLHHLKPFPVVYRDLKPSNIIIGDDFQIHLIDFGSARHYSESDVLDTVQLGTVGFAAPEQYELAQSTPVSDLYSLGAMLYFLLSCRKFHYFTKQDLHQLNPKISTFLSQIIGKLLSYHPHERFQDASELKTQLQQFTQEMNGIYATI